MEDKQRSSPGFAGDPGSADGICNGFVVVLTGPQTACGNAGGDLPSWRRGVAEGGQSVEAQLMDLVGLA